MTPFLAYNEEVHDSFLDFLGFSLGFCLASSLPLAQKEKENGIKAECETASKPEVITGTALLHSWFHNDPN